MFPPSRAPPAYRHCGSKETHIYLKIEITAYLPPHTTPKYFPDFGLSPLKDGQRAKVEFLLRAMQDDSKRKKNLPTVLPGLAQLLKWEGWGKVGEGEPNIWGRYGNMQTWELKKKYCCPEGSTALQNRCFGLKLSEWNKWEEKQDQDPEHSETTWQGHWPSEGQCALWTLGLAPFTSKLYPFRMCYCPKHSSKSKDARP